MAQRLQGLRYEASRRDGFGIGLRLPFWPMFGWRPQRAMSRVSAFRGRVLLRAFWRLTRLLGDIGGGASKMPGALDRTLRPVACGAVSVPLDFRSAGYLGFRYPSDRLPPWNVLTTGRPDALGVHPVASAVERGLADLMGCERRCWRPPPCTCLPTCSVICRPGTRRSTSMRVLSHRRCVPGAGGHPGRPRRRLSSFRSRRPRRCLGDASGAGHWW